MATTTKASAEQLKGISSPAEVERLSTIIGELGARIGNGNIPVTRYAPQPEPNIQLDRIPEGFTYYDQTLKKVRTWDGSAWKDHW